MYYYLTDASAGQSLVDWAVKKVHHEGMIMYVDRRLVDTESISITNQTGVPQEIVYGTVETVLGGETVHTHVAFLLYGTLVYFLSGPPEEETADDGFSIVKAIATSIVFAPDAPTTLNELHGEQIDRQTIEEEIAGWNLPEPTAEECNYPCQIPLQASTLTPIATSNSATPTPTATPIPGRRGSTNPSAVQVTVTPPVQLTRRALPADWFEPTRNNTTVECGSYLHTGGANFALDIAVAVGNNVYAAKNGTVINNSNAGAAHLMEIFLSFKAM